MFYLVCKNLEQRIKLLAYLKQHEILAVFHYISLHKSPFYLAKYEGGELPESDRFTHTLVRLPLFYELSVDKIIVTIVNPYYKQKINLFVYSPGTGIPLTFPNLTTTILSNILTDS